jgi:hypothetical protein
MQIWHILAYFKPGVQLVILGRITGSLFFNFWQKLKARHWLFKLNFKWLAMGNCQPKH